MLLIVLIFCPIFNCEIIFRYGIVPNEGVGPLTGALTCLKGLLLVRDGMLRGSACHAPNVRSNKQPFYGGSRFPRSCVCACVACIRVHEAMRGINHYDN